MSDIKSAHHITHTVLSSGVSIHINDHVYLTPEHLGEAYYIGRIMEFCTSSKRKGLQARIAWFNRPKDVINRKSADPCLLVATMHSDVNPVSSIRGQCTVVHKYYVPKDQLDDYRKQPDHFYYNQLYDRYIQRVYDVVPCEIVQNIPMDILDALKQRYQFIVVEQGKASDLTVARRICCVCQEWAQSALSVKCAGCQKSFHMNCLNPPLARKPSKGFAWQCAFCTRQEILTADTIVEKSASLTPQKEKRQTRATRSQSSKPKSNENDTSTSTVSETSIKLKIKQPKKSPSSYKNQQIKMTHMWPFRYFGVNTNIMDILDVDDRIYPRAKSRIGAKYQASVPDFEPSVNSSSPASEVLSPRSTMKLFAKKNDRKLKLNPQKNSKRSVEGSPADLSPSNSIENSEPYIPNRGCDDTITYLYRPNMLKESIVDEYMSLVKASNRLPLSSCNSDLMDRALYELEICDYNHTMALENMSQLTEKDFNIPEWSEAEIEAFEQSIRENGHDLNFVKRKVQTKSMADIVRYFYQWKKTERYEPVYSEWTRIYRPTKKFKKFPRNKRTDSESIEKDDNRSIESEEEEEEEESEPTIVPKATYSKKSYQCMNCLSDSSKVWRRSPSDIDRKRKVFNKVLCDDCGVYWLKYAKTKPISSETKLANIANSHQANNNSNNNNTNNTNNNQNHNSVTANTSVGNTADMIKTLDEDELKRKRPLENPTTKQNIKKIKEETKSSLSTLQSERIPCIICSSPSTPDRLYTCSECGVCVHEDCYGVEKETEKQGWRCDTCDNKYNPVSSFTYECVLCFKSSPQPLKRTAGYYWAHVHCASFIPEIKFTVPHLLSPVEYIGCVNTARLEANCQLCKETRGACVACSECKKTVHVQCALDHHFKLAFEIQPNTHNSNKITKYPIIPAGLFGPSSLSGLMIPQVWCSHHHISNKKLIDLSTRTNDDTQESSLMIYVKNYKCVAKGTTPAMRRLFSSRYKPSKSYHSKILNPRDAALEALTLDEQLSTAPVKAPKISVLLNNTSKSSQRTKRVCASEGCLVQHTPIWWSIDGSSDKKICQRCHHKLKTDKKLLK